MLIIQITAGWLMWQQRMFMFSCAGDSYVQLFLSLFFYCKKIQKRWINWHAVVDALFQVCFRLFQNFIQNLTLSSKLQLTADYWA